MDDRRWLAEHGIEQLGGMARNLAHPVAAFYRQLRAEGMEEAPAIALASAFLCKLLGDMP